jgi:hypothetical protein
MLNAFFAQIETPTPTPDELIDKTARLLSIWDNLGPLMAILALMALAFLVIGIIAYFNRNNSSVAIEAQNKLIDRQEKDISELKQEIRQERKQNIETFKVISDQLTRGNDLWEASNTQAGQRVSQQQRIVDVTAQVASDLKMIATVGSVPVQEIKVKVNEIVGIVTHIDTRTADWNAILETVTPLLVELGTLRTEAKKHKTQPIPVINPQPDSKIVIEGTVEGTVIQGGNA